MKFMDAARLLGASDSGAGRLFHRALKTVAKASGPRPKKAVKKRKQ